MEWEGTGGGRREVTHARGNVIGRDGDEWRTGVGGSERR
jgi:hypothetical protein